MWTPFLFRFLVEGSIYNQICVSYCRPLEYLVYGMANFCLDYCSLESGHILIPLAQLFTDAPKLFKLQSLLSINAQSQDLYI